MGRIIGRRDGVVFTRLIDLHRVAVEVGVGEVVRRAAKIHQREIELLGIGMDARASTDDLLELGHRADFAIEHYQAARLGINAGRKQAGGRDDDGISRLRVDEVAKLVLAILIVAGDAHDVAMIDRHQVGVLVDERLAHRGGVLGVDAEHDRLLVAVAAVFQKLGDLARDDLRAFVDHDVTVVVLDVIDAVFDFVAVAVELAFLGPVALDVDVNVNLDDLVGRKKAVADALAQRVCEGRRTEVINVRSVGGFFWRGREADLGRARKMGEDFPPSGVVRRAAPVTLVDHDQIEEIARKFLEDFLVFFRAGDRLIEAKINLERGVDATLLVER